MTGMGKKEIMLWYSSGDGPKSQSGLLYKESIRFLFLLSVQKEGEWEALGLQMLSHTILGSRVCLEKQDKYW